VIVFVSGEGSTDIGNNAIGPMAKLVDFKIREKCNIEYEFEIIHKRELKKKGYLTLPGKKPKRKYFFDNTYCLSEIIKKKLEGRENELLLVIFFRDSDTTEQKEWKEKYDSIIKGFKEGQCERGIPMLPKTSSEVWLLSSILNSHKMKGRHLEEIGDRDSLKEILEEKMENETIYDYSFDFSKIPDTISSYKCFKQDLESVLTPCSS
jgi:hypothetical protein